MSELKINDKYKTLFEQPKGVRYYIVTGGRGSGKSFGVGLWSSLKTFQQNVKILYTRFTLVSAKKSIIPEFEEKIELLNIQDHLEVTQNEIVNAKTGSNILFSGIKTSSGNQTANLKSLQGVSVWILDEAEEENEEERFDKIDLSIRSQKSQNIVILILNPTTKEHWIYKRFFEERQIPDGFNGVVEDTCYIHTTYLDNKENLSDTFLSRIEVIKEKHPKKYQHQILGGWRNKAEGVIFENWIYGEFDESLPYFYGLDFGFVADPDACSKVAIDESKGLIYVQEMFYNYGQTVDEIAQEIKRLPKGQIVADSAEQRLINHLSSRSQRSVIPVKKGAGSVLQGVRLMSNYQIVVCGDSPNLVSELNNYVWNGKSKEAPKDDYNHLIDGIRYIVYTFANNQVEPFKRNEDKHTRHTKGLGTGADAAPWTSEKPRGKDSLSFF